MYYSETLDRTITDKVFRIVKIGSRPVWHIYGIPKKEYHDRMKTEGFLIKESDTLVRDFKQGLLTKFLLLLRRVDFALSLCCRNVSPDAVLGRATDNLVYCEVSGTFKNTLDEWVKKVTQNAWDKYTIECDMLRGGPGVWEPEVCKHETVGFINGIKINTKVELEKPKEKYRKNCEKESKVFDFEYNDWGTGPWNKWSDYEKPTIHGVRTYVN
jgi:hypothetical protein